MKTDSNDANECRSPPYTTAASNLSPRRRKGSLVCQTCATAECVHRKKHTHIRHTDIHGGFQEGREIIGCNPEHHASLLVAKKKSSEINDVIVVE